jgi:hypothetical protein
VIEKSAEEVHGGTSVNATIFSIFDATEDTADISDAALKAAEAALNNVT